MKKLITAGLISGFLFFSPAKALDGEIIFRDTLYGAGIGALAGGAYFLIDDDDFGKKVGTGLLVGLVVGFAVGVYESQTALVEIKNGKMHAGLPQINIKTTKDLVGNLNGVAEISLLGVKF